MQYSFFDFMLFLGSMALFLYGMKTMSEGLQKLAGDKLRNILTAMTKNRFMAVLTGVFITAVIQSSSATTVMVVSFVNAGLLTLTQSISVILGANIGTTLTAWIISWFGFKVDISALTLPILAIAIPLIFSKKSSRKSLGEFIFGFAFLFMGLAGLKDNVPDLAQNPDMLEFLTSFTDMGYGSILLFFLIGAILTVILQSSSATMAITLIMCAQGWISYELGAALVLGENLGTTLTANIAALTANTSARRAALSHFIFNMFGVLWVLILFYPATKVVSMLVDSLTTTTDPQILISFKLSAFHTCYNITNTFIFVWFVGFLERVVIKLIPKKEEEEEFRLKFIQSSMLSTAELSLIEARMEINLYAERVQRMFEMVKDLLEEKNSGNFSKTFSRIEKYENISDNMELEIANYLNKVSEGRLSAEGKNEIRYMLREVTEIESIADSCYNLAKTLNRKIDSSVEDFTDNQYENIRHMFGLLTTSLQGMQDILEKKGNKQKTINEVFNLEVEINNFRTHLKLKNINDVDNKLYSYESGVFYMDIIGDSEKLNDYVVNVIEAETEQKEKKEKN